MLAHRHKRGGTGNCCDSKFECKLDYLHCLLIYSPLFSINIEAIIEFKRIIPKIADLLFTWIPHWNYQMIICLFTLLCALTFTHFQWSVNKLPRIICRANMLVQCKYALCLLSYKETVAHDFEGVGQLLLIICWL